MTLPAYTGALTPAQRQHGFGTAQGQDRPGTCRTRGRAASGQRSIRPGGTGFRHPQHHTRDRRG
jgi:hypothetical protein